LLCLRRAPYKAPGPEEEGKLVGHHIALLVDDLGQRGVQRVVANLAGAYDSMGHRVDLIARDASGPMRAELTPGVRVIELGGRRVSAMLPGLTRYLRRERPGAVLSSEGHVNAAALLARRFAGWTGRLSVSVHADPQTVIKPPGALGRVAAAKEGVTRRLLARLYPTAEARVAVSGQIADRMAAYYGLARETVSVIHNPAVWPGLLHDAALPPPHPWLEPGQPPVILGVGAITHHKGFDVLLDAFIRLRAARPARLMILGGPGPSPRLTREMLAATAERAGLAEDVLMPGWVSGVGAYFAHAGLFVLSSRWEPFGNVLVEAMACGCPVIATRCPGGPGEILEDGRHGPMVPPGDPAALAKAMAHRLGAPRGDSALTDRAADFTAVRIGARYLDELGLG